MLESFGELSSRSHSEKIQILIHVGTSEQGGSSRCTSSLPTCFLTNSLNLCQSLLYQYVCDNECKLKRMKIQRKEDVPLILLNCSFGYSFLYSDFHSVRNVLIFQLGVLNLFFQILIVKCVVLLTRECLNELVRHREGCVSSGRSDTWIDRFEIPPYRQLAAGFFPLNHLYHSTKVSPITNRIPNGSEEGNQVTETARIDERKQPNTRYINQRSQRACS